ncbi:hypothetical protein FVE85_5245 [Porphyridium purpureum]|uniref:Glycerophosphoryl diester phosphodiesterase membrane domain-containing protein n=1 Tax=Porphyridium purpureum TaxID=35688 RepID=A0A5J4Z307_PORPP|nr:hypothetical protein FVE85_5245 [Porphyridium purpureum]|eukprot:POR8194..scf295_1
MEQRSYAVAGLPPPVELDVHEVRVGNVFDEASAEVYGQKWTINLAVIMVCACSLALQMPFGILLNLGLPHTLVGLLVAVQNLVGVWFSTTTAAGLVMMAIFCAVNRRIETTMAFRYVWDGERTMALVVLGLIQGALVTVGLVLLVIPGIYLSVAYSFAVPLMVEKNLGVWESLETSRKKVTSQVWGVLLVYILFAVLFVLSIFTLGIALIWVVPVSLVAQGVMYRTLFGVGADNQDPEAMPAFA